MSASLFVSKLTVGERPPQKWLLFLHGILGSGANWRSFARKILEPRPHWGALLVDLRMHGQSHYGMLNRLWTGLVDMAGVMWLAHRARAPRVAEQRAATAGGLR